MYQHFIQKCIKCMKSSLKISLSMTGTHNCNSGGKINICISKLSLESAGNQMISTNCNYVLKHTCVIKSNTRCTFKYAYVNSKLNFHLLGSFFCSIGGPP